MLIEIIESFPGGVIPVYPLVEGVTQAVLQRCVRPLLDLLDRGSTTRSRRCCWPSTG